MQVKATSKINLQGVSLEIWQLLPQPGAATAARNPATTTPEAVVSDEYKQALAALRQCTLAELHRLLMHDLRKIQKEKAEEAQRTDWEEES